jgi:signal transduction histidine kinase
MTRSKTASEAEHIRTAVLALAHEIRNPLTTIRLSIESLTRVSVDDDRNLLMDIIARSTDRINELVVGFLKESARANCSQEVCSVEDLVHKALFVTNDRIKLKGIKIKTTFSSDCYICVDKEQVVLALINIIINAVDAVDANSGHLTLSSSVIDGSCIINITDNGKGLSEEEATHLFEPYFSRKTGGLGIGLMVTQEIISANNGAITVTSKAGVGSSFIITLPKFGS